MARLRALMAVAIGAALTASCGAQFKPSHGGDAPQTLGKTASDGGGHSDGGASGASSGGRGGGGGPY